MSRLPKLLLVSTALITLAACRDDAKRPPAALAVTTPVADLPLAPEGAALTVGPPAPVGRLTPANYNYAWAERAYAVDRALYAARPDYEFEYDGIEPWAWETEDDWILYAEPLETGYRYYYYEPGEDYPYFVRDPDYGYGYDDGGRLVTVYTIAGLLLSPDYLYDRAPIAGRYWTRGMDLRRAAYRAPHRPIEDAIWREREPVFVRTQEIWTRAADEQPQWREYRRRDGGRDLRRLEPERQRRETIMARYQPRDRDDLQWRPERREKDHGRRSFAEASGPDVDRFRVGDHEGRRMEREARAQDDRREARDHGRWAREQQFADQDRRNRQEAQDRGRRDHEQRWAQDQDRRNRQEAQDRGRRDHEQRTAQDQDRRNRQEAQDRGRRDHEQRMAQDQDRRNRQEAQDRGRRDHEQRMAQEQDRRNRQEAQDRGRRDHEQRMAQEQDRRNRQEAQDRGRRDHEQRMAQEQDRRNRQEAQDRGRRDREQQAAQQQDRGNGRADRGGQEQAQQADRHGGGKRGGDQAADAGKAGRDAADREKGHGGGGKH